MRQPIRGRDPQKSLAAASKPDPKTRLLDATMDYVRTHGASELSVRRLAKALGTSDRMLIYHFGSKEGLQLEVVRRLREVLFQELAHIDAHSSYPEIVERMWRRGSDTSLAQYQRLFHEMYGQALQGRPHTAPLLHGVVDSWIVPLTERSVRLGIPLPVARAETRLGLAVLRGLLLDLLATGDRKAVEASMERFLFMLREGGRSRRKTGFRSSARRLEAPVAHWPVVAEAAEPADPKSRLLAATMDYVRRKGASELSLRQLAAALGTSHRMLVYHFGSKEGLLIEVVRAVEAQQRNWLQGFAADTDLTPADVMRRLWRRSTDPSLAPNERLFIEMYGQALVGRPHTASLLPGIVESWVGPVSEIFIRSGAPPDVARANARLWIAAIRGLLLDLLATHQLKAVDAGMEYFIELYEATGTKRPQDTRRSTTVSRPKSAAPFQRRATR